MIQNFEARGGPEYGRKNLPKLRDTLKKLKLDGFLYLMKMNIKMSTYPTAMKD